MQVKAVRTTNPVQRAGIQLDEVADWLLRHRSLASRTNKSCLSQSQQRAAYTIDCACTIARVWIIISNLLAGMLMRRPCISDQLPGGQHHLVNLQNAR